MGMGKLSLAGLISVAAGLVVLVFQAISSLMDHGGWQGLNLDTLLDRKYLGWLYDASFFGLEAVALYLVTMPLFLLLIGLGVSLLAISLFIGK